MAWRQDEEVLYEYRVCDTEVFRPQIEELRTVFRQSCDEWSRVLKIMGVLQCCEFAFPIFTQLNDPQQRIVEGMHRSVAMLELSAESLPVLRVKYADWTPETPP